MSCPETLTHAAVQACVTLNGVIEALFDEENPVDSDSIAEIRSELCGTYAALCEVLSRDFKGDVHAEIQKHKSSEIGAWRTILKAKGVL